MLQAGNYYEVLGLGQDAGEDAVRRAKRTLSLATHPDKVGSGTPGANQAFNLVVEVGGCGGLSHAGCLLGLPVP